MGFSAEQLRLLQINAKCSGSLSVLGSSSLIYEIVRKRNKKDRTFTLLNQILLGMSSFDIGVSTWYIVGSWAIPKGTEGNLFQPSGNDATCTAQGFLFQSFASAIPAYNLSLAVYYYSIINHSWREERLRKYWWAFHIIPVFFGTSTATYGVITDQFNPNELWCWFSGTEQSDLLKFLFFFGPLWVVFFIIMILFTLMYRHVRRQENANARYSFAHQVFAVSDQSNISTRSNSIANLEDLVRGEMAGVRRLSRPVFVQGLLFALVFVTTFFFPTLFRTQQLYKDDIRFGLPVMMTLFLPLQGFLNYLVFKRLDIIKFFQNVEMPPRIRLSCLRRKERTEDETTTPTRPTRRKSLIPPTLEDVSMALQLQVAAVQEIQQEAWGRSRKEPKETPDTMEANEHCDDIEGGYENDDDDDDNPEMTIVFYSHNDNKVDSDDNEKCEIPTIATDSQR